MADVYVAVAAAGGLYICTCDNMGRVSLLHYRNIYLLCCCLMPDACTVTSLWRTAHLLCCTSAMLPAVSLYLVVRPSCLSDLFDLGARLYNPNPCSYSTHHMPLFLLYPRPMPPPATPTSVISALCHVCRLLLPPTLHD